MKVYDPEGEEIAQCMMDLRGMAIATSSFTPNRTEFAGRNPFVAQVKVTGPTPRACMVLMRGEVYDTNTEQETTAVLDVTYNIGYGLEIEPQ